MQTLSQLGTMDPMIKLSPVIFICMLEMSLTFQDTIS